MMCRALLLLVCGALMTAGCIQITGERDVLEGHMLRHQPYATFPQPNPPEALPLPGGEQSKPYPSPGIYGARSTRALSDDRQRTQGTKPARPASPRGATIKVQPAPA